MILSFPTENDGEENKNNGNAEFNKVFKSLGKCRVVGPPVSYDYPTHPFFLTASRKVVTTNITFHTLSHTFHVSCSH